MTLENFAAQRAKLLLLLAVGYCLWRIPELEFIQSWFPSTTNTLGVISIAGTALWMLALVIFVVLWSKREKNMADNDKQALHDELFQQNKSQSFIIAYISIMVVAVLLYGMSFFVSISGIDVAHILLILGVAIPSLCMAFKELG